MKVKPMCVAAGKRRKVKRGAKTVKRFRKPENGRRRLGKAPNYSNDSITQKGLEPCRRKQTFPQNDGRGNIRRESARMKFPTAGGRSEVSGPYGSSQGARRRRKNKISGFPRCVCGMGHMKA